MATDKQQKQQYKYTPAPDKDYSSSIAIQLPSTSANHQATTTLVTLDQNSNHINTGSLLDHCYRQAAARSFLLESGRANNNNHHNRLVNSADNTDDSPTPPPHYHEIPGIVPAYQGRTSGPPPSYDEVVNPNAAPPSYQSLYGQVREASKTSNGLVDLFRQLFLILIGTLGCTMIIGFLLFIPIAMILIGIIYVNECRAENIPAFLVIGGLVWIVKNILNCYNNFKKDSSTVNRPPARRPPIHSSSSTNRNNSNHSTNVLIVSQNPLNEANRLAIQSHTSSSSSSSSFSGATISTTTTRSRVSSRDQHNSNRIRQPTMIGITSFKCESMLNYFLIVWFLAGCIVVYRIYEPDYDNPLSSSYCNRTVYLFAFWLMTLAFIIMAIIISCLCCLMASSLMSCNHIGR